MFNSVQFLNITDEYFVCFRLRCRLRGRRGRSRWFGSATRGATRPSGRAPGATSTFTVRINSIGPISEKEILDRKKEEVIIELSHQKFWLEKEVAVQQRDRKEIGPYGIFTSVQNLRLKFRSVWIAVLENIYNSSSKEKEITKRMHSSRMCTFAAVAVCWGGCLPVGGCVSQHALRQTPPRTEWQTGVKTLPCRNFVADGINERLCMHKT